MTDKKIKRRKIIGSVFLLSLVFYFIGLLWLLPTFLKTPINDQLKQYNLQVDYQRLWINPLTLNIHLQETELKNLSGELTLSAQKIDVDWQLWALLNRHINIDHLFLKQAEIRLEFNHNNQLISPSFEMSPSSSSPWQFNAGTIEVIDSSVIIKKQDQRLPFNDINLHLNLAELINPQNTSPNQTTSIDFKTSPEGEFSVERSADQNSFHWQLKNWPLQQFEPWLSHIQSDIELTGQLSASGSLQWPAEQLPIIQITETDVTINQFKWPPFQAHQAEIDAQNITFDPNNQQVHIAYLNSPTGEITIGIDPLEITGRPNQNQTSESNWQAQFDSMNLNDWAITIKDKRPAVKAVIKQLTVKTESQQQNMAINFELTAPFDQPVRINAQGQINPLQLQGEIKAEALALEVLNPWLQALSSWQIEQALLSVTSRFCVQNDGLIAHGDWSLPQLSVKDGNQRIDATQTSLQSIGLYFDQNLLTLNNLNNQSIETHSFNSNANTQSVVITNNTPQSTEQQWRVVIGEGPENPCKIKLLQPL